jgi:predicted membrane-bound spermidine synthase
MTQQNKNAGFIPIHLIIFLAGFTFLIYEVSWNRMLSLLLGATVMASTLVLMAFMAGFGAGAYYWGKKASVTGKTGRLLAFLLGGAGLAGLLNYYIISLFLPGLYATYSVPDSLVFTIALLFLSAAAFLMGGVIPLVSKIVIRNREHFSSSLGRIYAFETLGSTLGGLSAGFLLLGTLGQKNTVFLAVAINLLLAAWLLLSKLYNNTENYSVSEDLPQKNEVTSSEADRRTAVIATLASGFFVLGLQVVWIRFFRIYLTNTSYTFALITSLVIFGLFAGSWLYKRRGDKIQNPAKTLIRVLLWMVLLGLSGAFILVKLPELVMFPLGRLNEIPAVRILLIPAIASLLVVLPPSLLSGFGFPLACRVYSPDSRKVSRNVGIILMYNTVGSVLGPFLSAFILIPLLGVVKAILLLSALLLSALVVMRRRDESKQTRNMIAAGFLGLLAVIFLLGEIKILPPSFKKTDREILYYKETVEGTLVVAQEKNPGTFIRVSYVNNSAVIGSTYDAVKAVKMIGHLPFFAGLECKNVLVVGFGMGVTTSAIAGHPEVEHIDCVEIVPGLKEAAPFYKELNNDVINDPRLNLMAGDGRHFLQKTSKMYDLISCDPTHPVLGSGNLYTKEYFELCKVHLNDGGMVSQYLPLHKLRTEDFLGLIKTFQSVFPYATVWLGQYHAILLGSKQPMKIDFNAWSERIKNMPEEKYFYFDPYHLAVCVMMDDQTIKKFPQDIRINTDDRSYTEFFSLDCFDPENLPDNLAYMNDHRCLLYNTFYDVADQQLMEHYLSGNKYLTESLYDMLRGDRKNALEKLREAVRVNPEDAEYPFLLRFYYHVAE